LRGGGGGRVWGRPSARPRSVESVLSVWAVTKTGAAFVPVDPDYPVERIEHMLTDSGATVGLTVAEFVDGLPPLARYLVLDDPEFLAAASAVSANPVTDADRISPLSLDHPAYVIYTSGSTGTPKGVVVPHRGLANFAASMRERFTVTPSSRTLHLASPSFDASILELLLAIGAGAAMVVARPGIYGGTELADLLRRDRVSHAFITPAALDSVDPHQLDDLVCVVTGADSCPPELVGRWVTASPEPATGSAPGTKRRMFNGYGPTEATIAVALSAPMIPGETVVIGRPVRGCGLMVLDSRLRAVPLGVPGELYITGPALARGYRNRSGTTSDRFVANPYGGPGERMYRTGDLVRWNRRAGAQEGTNLSVTVGNIETVPVGNIETVPVGDLEYLGRTDFQVKIRGFRIELGEIESALARYDGVSSAVATAQSNGSGPSRLIGYVVPESGAVLDETAILSFVSGVLAPYMVPAALVVLDGLPLTPAGKLDRKALPKPDFGAMATTGRGPTSELEAVLATLFAEVLGLDAVGVDDSFFALGGDSIMSIQLVARAKAAGVMLSPRDVFEHKTISRLATVAVLGDASEVNTLEELAGGGVGDMPLTPIVAWLVERGGNFDRLTQSALLIAPEDLTDTRDLGLVVQTVIDRHDMLRARLRANQVAGPGLRADATMEVTAPGSVPAAELIRRVEVTASPADSEFDAEVIEQFEAAERRLDPAAGVMMQVVWLDSGAGVGRILLVLHHAVVDGVSWRILVPDMASAWAQVRAGQDPELESVGTSMRRWAFALAQEAENRAGELVRWREMLAGPDPVIGSRALDPAVDTNETVRKLSVELPTAVTDAVLTRIPEAFHGSVNDGLLTALAMAVSRWRRTRGVHATATVVNLEGHGREDQVIAGADLSRTVGWFTTVFPMRLDLSDIDLDDAFAGGRDAGAAVKAVKERLLSIPDHGIGFGMLRHLSEHADELRELPTPQISFNYLGRLTAGAADDGPTVAWSPVADTDLDLVGTVDVPLASVLDINAVTTETVDGPQLRATWTFPDGILTSAEVSELADMWTDALTALARHVAAPTAGGLTPSDLDLVDLEQRTIERLEDRFPELTDIWSLSPLQSGLLFHALLADKSIDQYTVQLALDVRGADPDRIRRAAQALLDRHPNLRTSFVADIDGVTVQVQHGRAVLPWAECDVSALDEQGREAEIARVLDEDRQHRFDMATPPLLRFLLIRTGPDTHRLVMTNHHILLDGWSAPLLLRELLALYATDGDATALPRANAYRDYLKWLSQRDSEKSLDVWMQALAGVDEPTLVAPLDRARLQWDTSLDVFVEMGVERTERLRAVARERGLTLNTLIRAAWGIIVAELTGRDDVVFGSTVSGRPPQIPGIESMIGLFINTLPVRITLDPRESLDGMLRRIQDVGAGGRGRAGEGVCVMVGAAGAAAP
ncbi:condensation domain-containing protein, partial [Rhodococcus sp. NPDC058514]|uniref:condensation domain-containing protein n=1 Tax=Rhodococcus sp. NPDC058514 TaxID=3346532 RepID=UPI00364C7F20